MSTGQTYGRNLPDQVDRIATLSDTQLELLSDVRELHRDRVALEREYAGKLQLLAKKAAEKKSKKMAILVVGHEPTKAWDESILKQRSGLNLHFGQCLLSTNILCFDAAQSHINLADALSSQVVDVLKTTERRHDEAKKREMLYFQKLLSERDRAYTDRVKSKQKYDEECIEVETYRQKQERSADDRHADRAAKQYEQQQVDMLNSKNAYLISTAIANKIKAKFYSEDLPALEDQFQNLQTQLLTRFVEIMLHAQALQSRHYETLKALVTTCESVFGAVNPQADQNLFINHNINAFVPPPDWEFEPCSTHYDHGEMSVEPAPKVYLQNRLSRCRAKLQELQPVLDSKHKEVDQLEKLVVTYSADRGLGNVDEVSDNYLEAQHQFTFYSTSRHILTSEIEVRIYSVPYLRTVLVPVTEAGVTLLRTLSLYLSIVFCHLEGSFVHYHDSDTLFFRTAHTYPEEAYLTARVLFNFTPTSPFELAVTAETSVQVLEEDDGSGWIKVADNAGGKGLVPASYIKVTDSSNSPSASTPSLGRPRQHASGNTVINFFLHEIPHDSTDLYAVRGIYPYQAQGPDELDVDEGRLIELTDGPSGGQNYADGWGKV
ncbi:Protein BZZ1 [Grifola frondosa]|uniref:Protein BZZ1 n=1 Tax=Grifola frondosa TaxID=5627 RepID=A0A1C7LVG6_GRIFR|nr:Protein BZZ1 [Grifola frondosa]